MLLNTPDIEIFDKVPIRYKLFIDDHSYDIHNKTYLFSSIASKKSKDENQSSQS